MRAHALMAMWLALVQGCALPSGRAVSSLAGDGSPLGGGALGAGAQAQDEKSRTGTRRQMLAGSSGSVVNASKGRGNSNEIAGPPVGGAVGGVDWTQGQIPIPKY